MRTERLASWMVLVAMLCSPCVGAPENGCHLFREDVPACIVIGIGTPCVEGEYEWTCFHQISITDPVGVWWYNETFEGYSPPFAQSGHGICRFRRGVCGTIPGSCAISSVIETFSVPNFLPPAGDPNCVPDR